VRDLLAGDFLAVHAQDSGTALAEAGAVVLEVEHQRVLARRQRLLAFPAGPLQVEEVVGEDRFALEQVEAVTAEAAAVRYDHPVAAVIGDFHLRGDGVGPAYGVGRIGVGRPGQRTRVGEDAAPGGVARPSPRARAWNCSSALTELKGRARARFEGAALVAAFVAKLVLK
jgi:hypothetical protein